MSMRYMWHFLFCGPEAPGGGWYSSFMAYTGDSTQKVYLFCVKWYIIGLRNGPRGGRASPVQNFAEYLPHPRREDTFYPVFTFVSW